MKSSRIYDFTIPANGSFQLNVEGDYVRVMSGTGAIEIVTDNMRLGPLMAGQGQQDNEFRRLTLNDKSGSVNVGTILVASSGFIDQRINGEVSVIDGGKARSLAGLTFSSALSVEALAANNPNCQLWNPVGSRVNLVIEKISFSSSVAQKIAWGGSNAAASALTIRGNSKKTGAPNSKAYQCQGNTVGLVPGFYYLGILGVDINVPIIYELREPIVITPGSGFTVWGKQINTDLSVTMEFFEDPI